MKKKKLENDFFNGVERISRKEVVGYKTYLTAP